MNSKMTVTIGIPAYNEEGNIGFLLKDLLNQTEDNYVLENIIVNSDASTDKTNELVRAFTDSRIKLITNQKREGQGARQNQIIEQCTSDVLVLLNADILIENTDFIQKLIEPIKSGADLVCGPLFELTPKTFIEKIICFGSMYRRRVYEKFKNGQNIFTCHGSHRALSKKFYTVFRFKGSIAEDAYSYLWCIQNVYTYAYAKDAKAVVKMPSNLNEHIRQSSRFFTSGIKLSTFFDARFLKDNYKWPNFIFFTEGIKMFFEHPIEAVSYALLSVFIMSKNVLGLSDKAETWNMVTSSKTLRT